MIDRSWVKTESVGLPDWAHLVVVAILAIVWVAFCTSLALIMLAGWR